MYTILCKWLVAFALIGAIGKAIYDAEREDRFDDLYTESSLEARQFMRECLEKNKSRVTVQDHTIGAWTLTCVWREE